ncbi:GTPase Era [bacterium]|nr:GTPase Era [candidate division CSSED10-310 bacterium]
MKCPAIGSPTLKAVDSAIRCGFAALIGWTNVGKSSLINLLVRHRIAITSNTPQTTRNRIIGILHGPDYQIVLADTPGFHKPGTELSRRMLRIARLTAESADALIWMVFCDRDPVPQIKLLKDKQEFFRLPWILAINKIDTIRYENLLPFIQTCAEQLQPAAIVPISARTGENVDRLISELVALLPESLPMYPAGTITDRTEKFMASEIVRQHLIEQTYHELPHASAVLVEEFIDVGEGGKIRIDAVIYIEKQSQKGIVIGKQGSRLKTIGQNARRDLAGYFEKPVDLYLRVKTDQNWRNKTPSLKRFGLMDF